MLNVSFSRDGKAGGFKSSHAELNAIEGHYFVRLFADVVDEPREIENSMRNIGLELGLSREDDNRLDNFWSQKIEQLLHGSNMTKILEDGVLKFELFLEQNLRPVGLLGIREDPSFVVLGFYHEDTKPGNEDVVNLSCAIAQRKGYVIHQVVVWRGKSLSNRPRKPGLAFVLETAREFMTDASKCIAKCEGEKDVEDGFQRSVRPHRP